MKCFCKAVEVGVISFELPELGISFKERVKGGSKFSLFELKFQSVLVALDFLAQNSTLFREKRVDMAVNDPQVVAAFSELSWTPSPVYQQLLAELRKENISFKIIPS